jgi:UDP-glucose 4-epimerase
MATKDMKKTDSVLVTGSKGFIGTHLMKALDGRGYNLDIRLRKSFDINDPNMVKMMVLATQPKAIVHLAAISNRRAVDRDPELALRTNIIGTFNVLRIAHRYNIRVILASSAATYQPELSLYGTTKDCMERLAEMFDNVVTARFYNVYGKGSKSVVNKFVRGIQSGRTIKLHGNTVRDYVHVSDVVSSIISLVDAADPPRLVEIGTGRGISLKKLVSMIEKLSKKTARQVTLNPIKEIHESRCEEWYGLPKVTLEHGIKELLI